VPLRVLLLAVDQPGTKPALDDGEGVVRFEAWASVQVQKVHQTMAAHEVVQTPQEQLRRLRRADEHVEAVAGGVVDEKERDASQACIAGPKVLAVAQHALHPVRIAPATHVSLTLARAHAGGQLHPFAGAPGRAAVDGLPVGDNATDLCASEQLRHRGAGVTLLFGAEEGDEPFGQRDRCLGPAAAFRLEGAKAALSVCGPPTLNGA
jgi:hypothetical protein